MSNPTTGSNHETTAASFKARQVTRDDVDWEDPRDLAVVWADMHQEFPATEKKALLPFDKAWTILEPVMKQAYSNEAAFNQALFKAVKTCFGTYAMTLFQPFPSDPDDTTNKNFIALDVDRKQGENYAIGLARNVSCTVGLVPEYAVSTSAGVKINCKMDHGSCLLLEQGNKNWRATDVFSVVELKTSKTSCKDFGLTSNTVVKCDLAAKHGPFGQALAYTLGCVLLYHARNGVLRDPMEINTGAETLAIVETNTPMKDTNESETAAGGIEKQTSFPLAVISGAIAGSVLTDKLRWVSGELLFPYSCGSPFKYCVKSYGNYQYLNEQEEALSIERALALYFDTLLFGLRAARRVLRDRVGRPYKPDPMSGAQLMIGKRKLDLQLIASPIPKPEHAFGQNTSYQTQTLVVSQAEFFYGHLNVSDTLAKSQLPVYFYRRFVEVNDEVPVLIKVSSKAVHPFLIEPDGAFEAIDAATDTLASPRIADADVERSDPEKESINREKVAGALLAVVVDPQFAGLITIMADLSEQNYKVLKPVATYPSQLSILWGGFKDLVVGVLLPLAKCGVIHADIRPGFDFTANILFKPVREGKVRMELVDFESLVKFSRWKASKDDIGYIANEGIWVATSFVWWQCIFVAYAWLEERGIYRTERTKASEPPKKQADMRSLRNGLITSGHTRLTQKQVVWHKWLPISLRQFGSKEDIREEDVKMSLNELEMVFRMRDYYRATMNVETMLEKLEKYLEDTNTK